MNDLKTLIDVSAGTRLPQYEPEIFSDVDLSEYYLRKLCGQFKWYYHGLSVPRMACSYAYCVMGSRWPEAEAIMSTAAGYRMWYNERFGTNI